MTIIFTIYLIILLLMEDIDAILVTSCSKDDFFLRKVNKRYLVTSDVPTTVIQNITKYQQCFGDCQQNNCSIFNFQQIRENEFNCSIYSGNETRFNPSVRLRSESSDLLFFERLRCHPEVSEFAYKGSYPQSKTCKEVQQSGAKESGIYEVQEVPQPDQYRYVLCEMKVLGGGWTIIQRNKGGNFNQGWNAYKRGFGDYRSSFWGGNDFIYQLTRDKDTEVLIILTDVSLQKHYAYYGNFYIENEDQSYRLTITDYEARKLPSLPQGASITQQMYRHNQMNFATYDRTQGSACPATYLNGWWYNECHAVLLNGDPDFVYEAGIPSPKGIMWNGAGTSGSWFKRFVQSTIMVRRK